MTMNYTYREILCITIYNTSLKRQQYPFLLKIYPQTFVILTFIFDVNFCFSGKPSLQKFNFLNRIECFQSYTALLKKHKSTALFSKIRYAAKTQPDVWTDRQKMEWLIFRAKMYSL